MWAQHRGPDGTTIESRVADQLGYLSRLSGELGVADLVGEYFTPILGRWSAMHDEAERWRSAAEAAAEVTERLTKPLGELDAAWQGSDADSFIAYIRRVGLAGNDLSDAMHATADVLDATADAIRRIALEMSDILAVMAEDISPVMARAVPAEHKVRGYLDDQRRPVSELHESVRDVLDAFVRFCRGVDAGDTGAETASVPHEMPRSDWSPAPDPAPGAGGVTASGRAEPAGISPGDGEPAAAPSPAAGATAPQSAPAAASTVPGDPNAEADADTVGVVPSSQEMRQQLAGGGESAAVGGGASGAGAGAEAAPGTAQEPAAAESQTEGRGRGGGMGMMPMMGGMGAGGGKGGGAEHKSKIKLNADPEEIFGKPERTAPPVIGELPQQPKPKPESQE